MSDLKEDIKSDLNDDWKISNVWDANLFVNPSCVVGFKCQKCNKIPKKLYINNDDFYCKIHSPNDSQSMFFHKNFKVKCPFMYYNNNKNNNNGEGPLMVTDNKSCNWIGKLIDIEKHFIECKLNQKPVKQEIILLKKEIEILKKQQKTDQIKMNEILNIIEELKNENIKLNKQIEMLISNNVSANDAVNASNMAVLDNSDDGNIIRDIKWGNVDDNIKIHFDAKKIENIAPHYGRVNAFTEILEPSCEYELNITILKRGSNKYNSFRFGIIPSTNIVLNSGKTIYELKDGIGYFGQHRAIYINGFKKGSDLPYFGVSGDMITMIIKRDPTILMYKINGKIIDYNINLDNNIEYCFGITMGQIGDEITIV